MPEFDLHNLWEEANASVNDWYQQQRQDLLAKAQRDSAQVLQRIRRQFIWELVFTLLSGVMIVVWFYQPGNWLFWVIILFWGVVFLFVARIYYQFRRDITELSLLNVKSSTQAYLQLLRMHGKRLGRLYWVLGPMGLVLCYLFGFLSGSAANSNALQTAAFWLFSIPVLALTGWLSTYYVRWRYRRIIGQRELELEAIIHSLEEEKIVD